MWNFETSANVKKYFGANLKKAKTNHDKELKKTRDEFVKKYPYAKLSEFEFWINLSKNGDISSKTNIVYKGDGKTRLYDLSGTTWKYSWDITSDVFKYKYSNALYWGPSKIWDPKGPTTGFPTVFELGNGVLLFDRTTLEFLLTASKVFYSKTNHLTQSTSQT